jgi:hypothetical protein
MKTKAKKKVECPGCGRPQIDEGKRSSCGRCGLQPIPSYSYPRRSIFHPDTVPERSAPPKRNTVDAMYQELKARRPRK